MKVKYKLIFFCSFFLAFANIFLIFSYIISKYIKCEHNGSQYYYNEIESKITSNQIYLKFDIMDIYRIDISCDYIIKDLYQQVSTKYKNSNKKCSLSSLNPNVNKMILNSLISNNEKKYTPILDKNVDFDPYKNIYTNISTSSKKNLPIDEIINDLNPGGEWVPSVQSNKECQTKDLDEIAFIIPYSHDRLENLKLFLLNMHSYLKTVKYKFKYRIIVAEQLMSAHKRIFNKGRLINTAFNYIYENFKQVDCVVIHDVDILPMHDNSVINEIGDYRCKQMPWHLSLKVFHIARNYTVNYNRFLTGGILSLRPQHFIEANGFSNRYFGWGISN